MAPRPRHATNGESGLCSQLRDRRIDPRSPRMRLEHRVGDLLGVQPVIKAGDGLPALDDGRDELPHQVITEDGGRRALRGIARAARGLEIFRGNLDWRKVLSGLA